MSTAFRSRRVGVIGALSVAVSGVLLSATPALADVYTNVNFDSSGSVGDSSCDASTPTTYTGDDGYTYFNANSGPVSHTVTAHSESDNGEGESATLDLSDTTTANLTSSGDDLAAFQISSTGAVKTSNTGTVCKPNGDVYNRVNFDFTVATPGYLNLATKIHGPEYAEIEIESTGDPDDAYFDWEGEYTDVSSTHSVFLPAGTYSAYYESDVYHNDDSLVPGDGTTSASVNATFTQDGTVATPVKNLSGALATSPRGKGNGYTSLPLVRSCATNALVENVTSRKKRAKTIKRVTVFVDGKKSLTVKRPKAGRALIVPIVENGATRTVRTKITVKGSKRVYRSVATYNPCS